MENKYTVTYKVAPIGSSYVYKYSDEKHNAGDKVTSISGHMWYVLSDGSGNEKSYGFESKNGYPFDNGHLTDADDYAYQTTSTEITIALTEQQYNNLVDFSADPNSVGFNTNNYNVLTNSCVDFVYNSLKVIGYSENGNEGRLTPAGNVKALHNILYFNGAQIIRDNLMRNGDCYEQKILMAAYGLARRKKHPALRQIT